MYMCTQYVGFVPHMSLSHTKIKRTLNFNLQAPAGVDRGRGKSVECARRAAHLRFERPTYRSDSHIQRN